ncbi:protein roadkill [Trichonephila clavipes]|nr:protein roadkill [Trichonephila clavipes]
MDVGRGRFYWKIDNFGLYFLTQTEPLESPPFQIAGVSPDVSFRLSICKETRKQEMRIACFLIVSWRNRALVNLRIEGTVLFKLSNEISKITVVRKPIGSTLLIGKTAWSQTFPGNDFAKCSVSVMCHLWRSLLFCSKHCSAVTLGKYQKRKLVEKLRLSDPLPLVKSVEIPIDNSDEYVWVQVSSVSNALVLFYSKKWISNVLTKGRVTLMHNSNILLESIIPQCYHWSVYDEFWYLRVFFPSDTIKGNIRNYFKNNSPVCLKIEVGISLCEEFGSIRKYFSDSYPETSKTLRHRLKNDLERFFRSNRKGCDLIFRCEKKDYPVHKSLICCKSTVFSKMFESDMKEKKFGIVEMDDTDSLTLSRFIEYLYLGSVTDSTLDLNSAMALYAIAHRYSILDLVNNSRQFLVLNMVCGNSDEMLHFADLYEDKSLKNMIDYCFYQSND